MKITVKRYNPSVDAAPYYADYEVDYWDKMTVLEAINWINDNCERLAFDYNCRGRECGRCAVMLDGTPVLGCITMLTDGDHVIEPQAGFPVLRDLVVDKSGPHNRLAMRYNRVRDAPITEQEAMTYNMDAYETINGLEWCCRCHNCQVVCPVFNERPGEYVGPAMMVATALRFYDPYDKGDRVLEAVEGGLWNCIMCGRCTEACDQAEIDHLAIWQELRDAATERGLTAEALEVPEQDGSFVYAAYVTDVANATAVQVNS